MLAETKTTNYNASNRENLDWLNDNTRMNQWFNCSILIMNVEFSCLPIHTGKILSVKTCNFILIKTRHKHEWYEGMNFCPVKKGWVRVSSASQGECRSPLKEKRSKNDVLENSSNQNQWLSYFISFPFHKNRYLQIPYMMLKLFLADVAKYSYKNLPVDSRNPGKEGAVWPTWYPFIIWWPA